MKKKSKLEKPKLQTKSYYDYMRCRDYIVQKHKVDDDDFWNYLCDSNLINNGCSLIISRDFFDGCDDDVTDSMKEFYSKLMEEFCGDDEVGVEFEVYW